MKFQFQQQKHNFKFERLNSISFVFPMLNFLILNVI